MCQTQRGRLFDTGEQYLDINIDLKFLKINAYLNDNDNYCDCYE